MRSTLRTTRKTRRWAALWITLIATASVLLGTFQNCGNNRSPAQSQAAQANWASTANSTSETSVLLYHPGGTATPSPRVLVAGFGEEELQAQSSDKTYNYNVQSSLLQVISRGSQSIKDQFRADMSNLAAQGSSPPHPACQESSNPNLLIYTYLKPYTVRQADFLGWVHARNPQVNDILPAASRKKNGFLGNQDCPWGASASNISKTFGYSVFADSQEVNFTIDNRLNPWRWNAPINTIHPVEQPSFAVISHVKDSATLERTRTIFTQFRTGADRSQHIYLDYEIDFTVNDFRGEMNEFDASSVYGASAADQSNTLFGVTRHFAHLYGQTNGVDNYAGKRLVPPTVQLSLLVNFREDGIAWLENEFMLSSFNYETTVPNATSNPTINPYIFEGGTNESLASWYRLRMDALTHPGLQSALAQNPIITSGGQYAPITFTNGKFKSTLWGQIDLTNYYLLSHAHSFFPGMTIDIDGKHGEKNGINWAGVIAENHGPFQVEVRIKKLNIFIR